MRAFEACFVARGMDVVANPKDSKQICYPHMRVIEKDRCFLEVKSYT
jgi:hypothetical protein